MDYCLTTEATEVERVDRTLNPRQNTYLPYPPLPVAAAPEVETGLEEAAIEVTTASNSKAEPGGARKLAFEAIIGSPLQTVGPQDLVPAVDADSITAAELTVAVVVPFAVVVAVQVAGVPILSAAAVVGVVAHVVEVVAHVVAVAVEAAEFVPVFSVLHPVASAVALADVGVALSLAPAVAAG